MKVIKSLDLAQLQESSIVVALGSFDGLHLGHQAVIRQTIENAQEQGIFSGVYTFSPHPLKIINPAIAPCQIISPQQKIRLLGEMGIDYYFEQHFTPQFARVDYQTFIKNYLVEKLKLKHLVIGEDFRFGKQGRGELTTLEGLGKKYGFSVSGIKTVRHGGVKISSTRIRKLISQGKLSSIPGLLGRYYQIEGRVVPGHGRGKKLGFPTANLEAQTDYVLPPRGVYAVYVNIDNKHYRGLSNFGYNPTFANKEYSIEIHILDFPEREIYGQTISMELVDYIRKEMTFSSSTELAEQIRKDILYTNSLLCYN